MKKLNIKEGKKTKTILLTVFLSFLFFFLFFNGVLAQCDEGSFCEPILIISKSVDKETAVPGEEIIYIVTARNIGTVEATNVTIRDRFNYINQKYISFVSSVPGPTSGNDTWNIGTLAPAQFAQITIRARIENTIPVGSTEIKNRASVLSDQNTSQSSNCVSTIVTKLGSPRLSITKTVDKTSASPGDEIVYTLNYKNTGAGPANNVVVSDPFTNLNQNYLTFVDSVPEPASGNDTWNIGKLNSGESGQITIRATINNSVPAGKTQIKNGASIDSDETNLINSKYVSVYVKAYPSLSVIKLGRNVTTEGSYAEITAAVPGERIGFSLLISNNGNAVADNVWARDSLPYRMNKYVIGSTEIDGVPAPDGIKTYTGINIGSIPVGGSKLVTYEVDVSEAKYFRAGEKTLINIGRARTRKSYGYTYATDTAKVVVTKLGSPRLSITKTVDKTSASPGDEIVYTLNYKNTGAGPANNVVVSDPFTNLNQNYLTFVDSVPGPTSGNDTWNIGTLNSGESGQITIRATINNSVPAGKTQIKNGASIGSDETNLINSKYVSVYVSSTSKLTITKTVRNVSDDSGFSDSVSADPGKELEFLIEIQSIGNNTVNNVVIKDNLPIRLIYINGSTMIDGISYTDGIIGEGINIGNIVPEQKIVIGFRANVDAADMFNVNTTTLTNYVYAEADNSSSINSKASVLVYRNSDCSPSLQVNKLARNVTQNQSYFSDSIIAKPGDEIEFSIKITSVGSETALNTKIKDQVPARLNYVSGSTTVNGIYKNNDINSSGGLLVGDMGIGAYREVKFRVKIDSNNVPDQTIITNTAHAWADKTCSQVQDSAKITVLSGSGTSDYHSLSINKRGRNISKNQSEWLDSFFANPNEELEFLIQVTNSGNTELNIVKVWDTLPINISIVQNSTTIDGVGWGGDVVGAGLSIDNLKVGETKTIIFKGRVASSDKFGTHSNNLINSAFATASNVSKVFDQASVIIYQPGEVLGVGTVKTGASFSGLLFASIVGCLAAIILYCRIREEKLIEALSDNRGNKFLKLMAEPYFRIKLFFKRKTFKFRRV